jgi:hypothetical protein
LDPHGNSRHKQGQCGKDRSLYENRTNHGTHFILSKHLQYVLFLFSCQALVLAPFLIHPVWSLSEIVGGPFWEPTGDTGIEYPTDNCVAATARGAGETTAFLGPGCGKSWGHLLPGRVSL